MDDFVIREAAIQHVQRLIDTGLPIEAGALRRGFDLDGEHISLVGMTGIFRPKQMSTVLSVLSTAQSTYDDDFRDENSLLYHYHDGSKQYTNDWLRQAMRDQFPVLVFLQNPDKTYQAAIAFIVSDMPHQRQFVLNSQPLASTAAETPARYSYGTTQAAWGTSLTKTRRHQAWFRAVVMRAYESRCAVCALRHDALLDAAHILSDRETPEPAACHGIALCKIHHAAFDQHIMGVEPGTLAIAIREDVLREIDGPMLKHGIQEMAGRILHIPTTSQDQPNVDALELRWDRFRSAS